MNGQTKTDSQSSVSKLTSSRKLFSLQCLLFNLPFHLFMLFFSLSALPSMIAVWFSLPQAHPPVSLHAKQSIFLRHWIATSHFTYSRHTQLQGLWGPLCTSLLSPLAPAAAKLFIGVFWPQPEREESSLAGNAEGTSAQQWSLLSGGKPQFELNQGKLWKLANPFCFLPDDGHWCVELA